MGHPRILYLLLAAFFLKTCFLAIYVTPRWAVPDETGHYSYIANIAEGRGFPVLIKAVMDDYTVEDINAKGQPLLNNIAQHPPLYYTLMAPIHYVGSQLGFSGTTLVYIFRVISALTATALLWVVFQCSRLIFRTDPIIPLVAIGIFSCIPMFTMIAGGVSSTPLLALFLATGIYFWIRSSQENSLKLLYLAGLCFSVACITKYTAVPIVAAWFLSLLITHWNWKDFKSYIHLTSLALMVALPLCALMFRNYQLFEQILPIYEDLLGPARGGFTFVELMQSHDVFTTLYRKFLSAIGWMQANTGTRITLHMELPAIIQWMWNLTFFALIATSVYFTVRQLLQTPSKAYLALAALGSLAAIVILERTIVNIESSFLTLVLWLAVSFVCMNFTWALQSTKRSTQSKAFYIAFAHLGILLLSVAIMNVMYEVSHFYGNLRAAHGRYFMPSCVLIVIGFFMPALSYLERWKRWLLGIPLALQTAELFLWVNYASTFFEAPL